MGRIGEAVAHRLKPFGISRILYWGRREKPELKERLPSAEFKKMKKNAVSCGIGLYLYLYGLRYME